MNGKVDDALRALLDVQLAGNKDIETELLTVWIDTAFNGGLVLPRAEIERLGLEQASTTEAILANGQLVDLETFTCNIEWFGQVYRTQVVANEGAFPLLGTALLAQRMLVVDYAAKTVSLD